MLSVFYSKKPTDQAQAAANIFNYTKETPCKEAISKLKEVSKERKFKESVEAIIRLNVDPRQGD